MGDFLGSDKPAARQWFYFLSSSFFISNALLEAWGIRQYVRIYIDGTEAGQGCGPAAGGLYT